MESHLKSGNLLYVLRGVGPKKQESAFLQGVVLAATEGYLVDILREAVVTGSLVVTAVGPE